MTEISKKYGQAKLAAEFSWKENMEQINLKATTRDLLGKKVKILRAKGEIPAVLYGRKFQSLPILIDKKEFQKVAEKAGEATLINLEIPQKEPVKVLIRDIQKDPVQDTITHIDLYKVDMTQEIQTEIPLAFVGASPAVEELEGNLISNKDTIEVECLPDKLVPEIKVDISVLKTFDDFLHIKDLKIPEGIKILDDIDDIVVQVTPPRSEEELKALEEETTAEKEKAQIETIESEAEKEKAEKESATKEETEKTEKSQTKTPPKQKDEKK